MLDELKVPVKASVASAHRTPKKVEKIVSASDADVFIAIAGLSAALPGVVAVLTIKPVIGVPVEAKLGGLDSLLAIAQLPPAFQRLALESETGRTRLYWLRRLLH